MIQEGAAGRRIDKAALRLGLRFAALGVVEFIDFGVAHPPSRQSRDGRPSIRPATPHPPSSTAWSEKANSA
jgi:hypothetical protein